MRGLLNGAIQMYMLGHSVSLYGKLEGDFVQCDDRLL